MVLVIGIALLMSCGGKKDSELTGKYSLTSMVVGSEDYFSALKDAGINMDELFLEFLSGNKFKIAMMDEVEEGTYTLSGNKITLKSPGKENTGGKVEGKKVTLQFEDDGDKVEMVFEKK